LAARTPDEILREVVRSVEAWLDRINPEGDPLYSGATEATTVLRRYLRHCRRRLAKRDMSIEEVAKHRKRIDRAVFFIMRTGWLP
jgi:hypothetical protein